MIRCSICSNPLDEKYNVCPYCGKRQNEGMNTSGENDNITNATPVQDKHKMVPTTADAEKMIPNKKNRDQFKISGKDSLVHGTTLYNLLSFNGIPQKITDPMKKIYGDISFACKISGRIIDHPGLQHLHAYVLLDRGIVFANDMGLFAWSSETGERIEYSGDNDKLKKIVSLKEIQPGKVEVKIYKSKRIIREYRNHDTNAGLDVEDLDEYNVELESVVFTPKI